MEEKLAWLITDLSKYSLIVPTLIGIVRHAWLQKIPRVIFLLVLLSLSTEIAAHLTVHQGGNQSLVYWIFTFIEFGLISYIFAKAIIPFLPPSFFWGMSTFFLLFLIIDMIWISRIDQFNNYSTAVESLIIIFFVLLFFYKTLKELKIKYLEREPIFWFSTGSLLYFSSSLFIFLFTNYVNSSTRALFIIWGIHGIFSILLNLFYSIALWVKPVP